MEPKTTITDDDLFLNDFHREHYYACEKENERVQSMHFTHEYAKAQSERMNALVQKQREEERRKRKNASKGGE
jgi:glycosylphosphatidylinositol transamidase (GPIT) subunit GPI8